MLIAGSFIIGYQVKKYALSLLYRVRADSYYDMDEMDYLVQENGKKSLYIFFPFIDCLR